MSRSSRPERDRIPPAEREWLARVFALADSHPVTPAERDRMVEEQMADVATINLTEAQVVAAFNRAGGAHGPELDEAVRLLSMYVERIRDGEARLPRPGPGGVDVWAR